MEQDRTTTSNNSKRQRRELDWQMVPLVGRSDFTIEIAAQVEDDNSAGRARVDLRTVRFDSRRHTSTTITSTSS